MRTVLPSTFLRSALALLLPCAALLAPLAAGAAEAPAGFDPFGEVLDVRLMNVEVVVTDRQGHRVHGLAPEDFRLLVDGQEVALDFFTEVRDGRAVDSAAATPAAPAGEAVGTSYLVFVDDFFPLARDRNRVLAELAGHLDQLGPADRMAVVAYDGRQLDLLSGWSASSERLAAALDAAGARPAYGLRRLAELRNHTRTLGLARDARSDDLLRPVGTEERFFAGEIANQVERTVAAATAALRGFATAPGRKVMLLLSGGWPYSPTSYVIGSRVGYFDAGEVPSGDEILRPLVDAANRVGYTVYPVDVPGLSRVSGADVEQGGLVATDRPLDGDLRFADFDSSLRIDREGTLEDSLRHLARETGGKASINGQRLAALPAVSADVGDYYWLGFTPAGDADDRRHRLRVVVDRPGMEVRSRQSYFDLTPAAERTMAVQGALTFGTIGGLDADETAAPRVGGAAGLSAEVGAAERSGRRLEVPLAVHIPTDMLTAVEDGDEWRAQVELRVGARDGQRRTSDVVTEVVELSFPEAPQPGRHVTFRNTLRLRDADQTLVIQVTDAVGGATRATQAEVRR